LSRRPAGKTKAVPSDAEITSAQGVSELAKRIIGNVEQAIVGKRKQLVLSLVTWLSGGHILLEDVPGVAKTSTFSNSGSAAVAVENRARKIGRKRLMFR
jgi:MoxR-like ATPase